MNAELGIAAILNNYEKIDMDKAEKEKCETLPIKLWSQNKKKFGNVDNFVNKCDFFTKKENQVSNCVKMQQKI